MTNVKTNDATGWYGDVLKGWQPKLYGPKPAASDLAAIHALGARPGKQALANAMALRPAGVTGAEIVMVCGAPQLNKMRGFINDGVVKREATPPRNGHTVYKLNLTPKGTAKIKAADKPAKVAATPAAKVTKPRKPKAKPAPVTAPAPVQAPVTTEAQPQA